MRGVSGVSAFFSERFARRAAVGAAGLIAAAFLVLSLQLPLSLLGVAGHDDALFWRLGESLARGRWLGRYDELTLAKGPGFPLLLALNAWLGTPLTLTLAAVQLAAASILACELRRWGMSRPWVLLIWAVLVVQPACLPTRVVRDHLYQALTLVVAASWLHLLRVPALAGPGPHGGRPVWGSVGLGAACGLFWATREEGLWVAPAYGLLAAHAAWAARAEAAPRRRLRGQRWAGFALGAALVLLLLSTTNGLRYGHWGVVDFKSAPFVELLQRLAGIEAGGRTDFVPVTRAQRERAYAVSAALRELQPLLERPRHPLQIDGCRLYPHTCGDFAGGWFMWALREAVAQAGHYGSAAQAATFYRRAAAELQAACEQGRLRCLAPGWSFLPRMSDSDRARLGPALRRALGMSAYREGVVLSAGPSDGPAPRLAAFDDFLGRPRHMPMAAADRWRVAGWFAAAGDRWIELRCGSAGQEVVEHIPRLPSPDLKRALRRDDVDHSRFQLERPAGTDCRLVRQGRPDQAIALSALRPGWGVGLDDDSRIHIDIAETDRSPLPGALRWKARLAAAYGRAAPALMTVAAGGWLLLGLLQWRRRRATALAGVATLCALSAGIRIALLALIDATSFPGVNVLYLGPSIQLWQLASLLVLHALWRHFHEADHPDALPRRG